MPKKGGYVDRISPRGSRLVIQAGMKLPPAVTTPLAHIMGYRAPVLAHRARPAVLGLLKPSTSHLVVSPWKGLIWNWTQKRLEKSFIPLEAGLSHWMTRHLPRVADWKSTPKQKAFDAPSLHDMAPCLRKAIISLCRRS